MSKDWLKLTDKVFIVTGGSSGIGAAIVHELLSDGAYVYNADLQAGKETNEKYVYVKTDVTSSKDVDNVVSKVIADHGNVDGLVNNAGINLPRLLVDSQVPQSKYEFTEKNFEKMFSVNVKSVFLMSQVVARELVKEKQGVIVNMSSEAGLEGSVGQSVYSATKGAINGFTRSWGKELGEHNVRVVGVAPGIMEATGLRTPTYEDALAYTRHKTVANIRAGYKSKNTTPLGRSGRLSEVANLVAYYLSDKASYITGVTTNVAGGKSRG
ncbi:SDR family NAD(P)-dependent oxidoreductase [Ligilactobacillus pobuzihii]|uniref:SDR family oxidoreductase n=1 Tax=Ligilactobacillus pobuzihii TaxID=449659 RepID=UPI0019D093F7|nr:SDR family oxidoreductase [Ligilactobacillus pobuzihii]MBN7274169.1 SDR family NAD(P)-dependent oxidoreductase [Ligilactobacillus pobuzihii]